MKIALYIFAKIGFVTVMSSIAICFLAFCTPVTDDTDEQPNPADEQVVI